MKINLVFKELIKPDILKCFLSFVNALLKTLLFSLTIPNIGLQVLLQTLYHAENLLDNMYLLGIKILFLQHESFMYSYKKSEQGALILKFILVKNSTYFGQTYCPSSGILTLYSQQLVFVALVMLNVC